MENLYQKSRFFYTWQAVFLKETVFFVKQNLRIVLSRVFISFEAFRLILIKKDRQNGEHRKGRVFVNFQPYSLQTKRVRL